MREAYKRRVPEKPSKELTGRQAKILRFIMDHTVDFGRAPTIREIGERMGIRSPNGVIAHITALVRKGYLMRTELTTRSYRPVGAKLRWVYDEGEDGKKLRAALRGAKEAGE